MTDKQKVLVTGASGLIGGLVIEHLGAKYALSALNRRPVPGVPGILADVADLQAIRPAFRGIHTVLHLAAATHGLTEDWDEQIRVTAVGTVNVYRAAQEAGVTRVVFMSSGSTMCGYEWYEGSPYGALARGEYDRAVALAANAAGTLPTGDERPWRLLTHRDPPRPDSPYGAAKAFGEVAGRWFADKHGLSVLCIRLGGVLDTNRPKLLRQFPGFLDKFDAVRMIEACIDAPESVRFDIFDAISDNATRWRDIAHAAKVLGWKPTGTSDKFDPNEFRPQPGPPVPKWGRSGAAR
ncbi:MAG: NAD(P)-dependent oxidoreductase [Actinobacteria bacterium]|nr:NAD(P)-dependent oxidoreductase [Actinomycetota bacterium]